MCCNISDTVRYQATTPFRLGGLGLHDSQCSSHPIFLELCISAWVLLSCLVERLDATLERNVLSFFENFSIPTSRVSFQIEASLDDQSFTQLLNTSTITPAYSLPFFWYQH